MSGRRSPLIAGVAAGLVCVLVIFFLVLPKRGEVADARKSLGDEQSKTSQLQAQLNTLVEAKAQAPAARAVIRKVDQQLPPTVDEPGLILLLRNAAERSGVSFTQISVSAPTASTTDAFSTIPVAINIEGTYFSLAEFLYRIETLPRAAKVLSGAITASTGGTGTTTNELSMQISMELYTSDTSAGPGSVPGPTTSGG
ncbi:MAG: type 4a pilus biogenesis protein PilO [Actinobacteria bacterium]|nr:type 4a pilus biogenesis protein PilO [Actinomycetota bacterium]